MNDSAGPGAPDEEYAFLKEQAPWILRRPHRRVLFLAVFLLTLPFTWGEAGGCTSDGAKRYTGLDVLVTERQGAVLALLVLLPVALSVLAPFLRRAGVRLACELIAGVLATFAAVLSMLFGVIGSLGAKGGPYLAPAVAALAVFAIAVESMSSATKEFIAIRSARHPK